MRGALIETEARKILNKGMDEARKKTAAKMLKTGKFTYRRNCRILRAYCYRC